MPRRPHAPTEESRLYVERIIANGVTRETIVQIVGIDPKTLEKHYGHELETGAEVANEKVAQSLYAKATDPKGGMPLVVAATFSQKTRARWKEASVVEHSGPDGEPLPANIGQVHVSLPNNGRDPHLLARPMKMIESTAVGVAQ
jgi:hypothetical protein